MLEPIVEEKERGPIGRMSAHKMVQQLELRSLQPCCLGYRWIVKLLVELSHQLPATISSINWAKGSRGRNMPMNGAEPEAIVPSPGLPGWCQ